MGAHTNVDITELDDLTWTNPKAWSGYLVRNYFTVTHSPPSWSHYMTKALSHHSHKWQAEEVLETDVRNVNVSF